LPAGTKQSKMKVAATLRALHQDTVLPNGWGASQKILRRPNTLEPNHNAWTRG